MANNFKRFMNASVGTSLEVVYTVPSNKNSIIIGCLLCNKTGSGITADVQIDTSISGGNNADVYLVKSVQIPGGSSIEIVEGKVVLTHDGTNGDILKVAASATSSLDITLSVLEDVT
jgi:hypothetical protein